MQLPRIAKSRLLIIRTTGDEASAAIAFSGFVRWIVSTIFESVFGAIYGPTQRAMERALKRVLVPLVYTTSVVGAGFAVLGFSEFSFTRSLGILTASIVVMCLVANAVLVPTVLGRESVFSLSGRSADK